MIGLTSAFVALLSLSAQAAPTPQSDLAARDGWAHLTIHMNADHNVCLGLRDHWNGAPATLVSCSDDAAKLYLTPDNYISFDGRWQSSQTCLDVTQGDPSKGLQGWECGFRGWGTTNQLFMWIQSRWSIDNKENMMMAWTPNAWSGGPASHCLAADGWSIGSRVVVRPCNDIDWQQRWGWNQVW